MGQYDNINKINRELEECKVALHEANRQWLLNATGIWLQMTLDLPEVDNMYPWAKVKLIQNTCQYLEHILTEQQDQKEIDSSSEILTLSFDLSVSENRKAMKKFGIENTSGVFTKLFAHGIKNFQELGEYYNSLEDITIKGFGQRSKAILSQYMEKNKIFLGN